MNYPGDTADPVDVAKYFAWVAENEYDLPGILPVMTSCVEITGAWTGPGDVKDVPGYLYAQDHDSLGYFQQRPSQGWGTPAQLVDADYALRAFCREAKRIEDDSPAGTPEQLGAWCQAVQHSAYPERYAEIGYPMAVDLLGDSDGGEGMIKAVDLVEACRLLRGVFYRTWYLGDSLPMWVDDGYDAYTPPPVSHMQNSGIMCADLVNWGLVYCGADWVGGTSAFYDAVLESDYFSPDEPGEAGYIAGSPYLGDSLANQGHVLLYTGAHSTIQALYSDGVTEKYTDQQTAGFLTLSYYGKVPGVDYSGDNSVPPSPFITAPSWVAINEDGMLVANGQDYSLGWYDTGYARNDWSWHGPKES